MLPRLARQLGRLLLPVVWRYEAVRVPGRLLYQQDAVSVAENICAVVAGIFIGWLIARGLTR